MSTIIHEWHCRIFFEKYISKVYIFRGFMKKESIIRKAKVFMSGNSQAVRLPRDFQFHSEEVSIEKKRGKIILWETPKNLYAAFSLLTKLPKDFYSTERKDSLPQQREDF